MKCIYVGEFSGGEIWIVKLFERYTKLFKESFNVGFGNWERLKVPFFRKLDGAQKNMPNHYFKLEFLKLHFVSFCFAADFQANPTDISSKKSGKNQMTILR